MLADTPYWTQAQLVAWIAFRDLPFVLEVGANGWQACGALINKAAELVRSEQPLEGLTLSEGSDAAVAWLSRGATLATGLKNGRGDRQIVPTLAWPSLKFFWLPDIAGPTDPARPEASVWHELLFLREDAMRQWPERKVDPHIQRLADPTHAPEGHEWLATVYERDIRSRGAERLEQVRRELAEGRVTAILRDEIGRQRPVPLRMWTKPNLEKKVYPTIRSGLMRMRINIDAGADAVHEYVRGWVFVPVGAFAKLERDEELAAWSQHAAYTAHQASHLWFGISPWTNRKNLPPDVLARVIQIHNQLCAAIAMKTIDFTTAADGVPWIGRAALRAFGGAATPSFLIEKLPAEDEASAKSSTVGDGQDRAGNSRDRHLRLSPSKFGEWYGKTHVVQWAHLPRHSARQDLEKARAAFPQHKITRDMIRIARKKHAPPHWSLPGPQLPDGADSSISRRPAKRMKSRDL